MNTYRVYGLNTAVALSPVVAIAYIQAEKYGDAWRLARAALSNQVPEGATKVPVLYADPECKVVSDIGHGKHVGVAKIDDIRPRNVKLDKTALQSILDDPNASAEDKLAALQAQLGTAPKAATPTPAPANKPTPKGATA